MVAAQDNSTAEQAGSNLTRGRPPQPASLPAAPASLSAAPAALVGQATRSPFNGGLGVRGLPACPSGGLATSPSASSAVAVPTRSPSPSSTMQWSSHLPVPSPLPHYDNAAGCSAVRSVSCEVPAALSHVPVADQSASRGASLTLSVDAPAGMCTSRSSSGAVVRSPRLCSPTHAVVPVHAASPLPAPQRSNSRGPSRLSSGPSRERIASQDRGSASALMDAVQQPLAPAAGQLQSPGVVASPPHPEALLLRRAGVQLSLPPEVEDALQSSQLQQAQDAGGAALLTVSSSVSAPVADPGAASLSTPLRPLVTAAASASPSRAVPLASHPAMTSPLKPSGSVTAPAAEPATAWLSSAAPVLLQSGDISSTSPARTRLFPSSVDIPSAGSVSAPPAMPLRLSGSLSIPPAEPMLQANDAASASSTRTTAFPANLGSMSLPAAVTFESMSFSTGEPAPAFCSTGLSVLNGTAPAGLLAPVTLPGSASAPAAEPVLSVAPPVALQAATGKPLLQRRAWASVLQDSLPDPPMCEIEKTTISNAQLEECAELASNSCTAPEGPMVRPYVPQAGWDPRSQAASSPSKLTAWPPAPHQPFAADSTEASLDEGSLSVTAAPVSPGLSLPALPLHPGPLHRPQPLPQPQLMAAVLPSPATTPLGALSMPAAVSQAEWSAIQAEAAATIGASLPIMRLPVAAVSSMPADIAIESPTFRSQSASTSQPVFLGSVQRPIPESAAPFEADARRSTLESEAQTMIHVASGSTLPVPPAPAFHEASSTSSVEVLPGSASGMLTGAFLCEVVILAVEFPPELYSRDFYSAISFTSFSQTNAQVASAQPHRFVVHTEEALSQNFVHISLQPHDSAGRFSQEFETFLPLAHVVERFGLGQGRCLALGMVPQGSGAAPSAIFQYCSSQSDSRSAGRELGGHAARISLACSIQQRPGSLWDHSADLDWPPHDAPRDKCVGECDEETGVERDARTSNEWDSQAREGQERSAESPGSCAQSTGQLRSPGATDEEAGDEVDEQQWLQEELKRARNELRMQQTLMNFQERRLHVFEAQSNAVAAVGSASEAYNAQMQDPDIHEQLRLLNDTVQTQQEEIHHLREHLAFYSHRGEQMWHQAQAQRRLEHALQQSQARMKYEIDARDQRIHELEMALQERDQQLDMIPDAVDSILRSPPRFQEEFTVPTPGSLQNSPHRLLGDPYAAARSGIRPQSNQPGFQQTAGSPQANGAMRAPFNGGNAALAHRADSAPSPLAHGSFHGTLPMGAQNGEPDWRRWPPAIDRRAWEQLRSEGMTPDMSRLYEENRHDGTIGSVADRMKEYPFAHRKQHPVIDEPYHLRTEDSKPEELSPQMSAFHEGVMHNGTSGGTADCMQEQLMAHLAAHEQNQLRSETAKPESLPPSWQKHMPPRGEHAPSAKDKIVHERTTPEHATPEATLFHEGVKHDGSIGGTADWMKDPLSGESTQSLEMNDGRCDKGRLDRTVHEKRSLLDDVKQDGIIGGTTHWIKDHLHGHSSHRPKISEADQENSDLRGSRPTSAAPQRPQMHGSRAGLRPNIPPETAPHGQNSGLEEMMNSMDYVKDPAHEAASSMGATQSDSECFTYAAVDVADPLDVAVADTVQRLALPASCLNGNVLQRISEGKYRFGEQRYVLRQLEDGEVYVRQGGRFVSIEEWLHSEVDKNPASWRPDEVECRSASPTASTADSHRAEFHDIHCY